ncbi:MAG: NADPH-dependent assimilatory sulfite reductase hemoprotein subunit [Planctomycetaceae bacterium]|nr:MAG: NADPH-dependent assimilatory sulfite reductase hemoprotein subunit [Planctomycetaceae bacterium]
MATDAPKLSPVESIKQASEHLRGTIGQELQDPVDHFDKDNIQLLKFHGTYQQDDRDSRGGGSGKTYSMMLRCRIPGGILSSDQFIAHLDLCDTLGNATMKLTTRQTIQLHGILKSDLKATIARINQIGLSTLAACGDVNRNVMCCPAKRNDPVRKQMQQLCYDIAIALAPQTKAYHELWMTDESGEKTLVGGARESDVVEPLYGATYLPRKFKMAVGLPEDNCVDLYTNDIGLLTIHRDGEVLGYNVIVGGGMGTTPSAQKTHPLLAQRMAFVTPDQVIDVCKAILMVQRDHGNREDRKVARMKYLVENWGIEKFRSMVEEYYGSPLADCTPDDVHGFDDHIGWQDQGDGLWSYGLNVENGRLYDNDQRQLKAGLRAVCARFNSEIRLTSHQSMIFCDIRPEDRDELLQILRDHQVPLSEDFSEIRRWSMACVALPTCGLAITESERALPGIIDDLEGPIAKLGLQRDQFTLRMTGCPNGCARPYNSDLAIVGKAKGKYTLFVGGALLGNRLNYIYKDLVPHETIAQEIIGVLAAYKANRVDGETLGGFCDRVGRDQLEALADAAPKP